MNKITEPLKQYLKNHDCVFDFDHGRQTVHFGMEGRNARWRCMGCSDESGRGVLVSLIPFLAIEHRRNACAELLMRINMQLGLGHFDLDFNDGELRFLTTVPVEEKAELSTEVIEHLIRGHHTIVDRFLPAISAVLFAGTPPSKAMELDPQKEGSYAKPRFSLN